MKTPRAFGKNQFLAPLKPTSFLPAIVGFLPAFHINENDRAEAIAQVITTVQFGLQYVHQDGQESRDENQSAS